MTAIWKKRLLALILTLGAVSICYALWRSGVLLQLTNRQQLIETLRAGGTTGPLLCIAIQFVQVVIFFIPGEITQFAAGYVFGAWLGYLYSVIGIMLGSAFNFYFARVFGRPALEKFIRPATLDKIDAAQNNAKGKSALFLLFLLPGLPKDAMSYAAGLSAMGLAEFVVISGLGRTPAMVLSILLGSQAYQKDYRRMAITAVASGLAIGAYFLYERRRRGAAS
jgi:uncharacterized membrane protein YdjX (TVP38/TMEM64 family)